MFLVQRELAALRKDVDRWHERYVPFLQFTFLSGTAERYITALALCVNVHQMLN